MSPTTTREVLYVAATRGRESNMLYVDTSFDPDPATGHDGTIAPQSASEVLAGVLANEGADLSAHETLERAQRHIEDFSVLAAEYETLARAAQQQRWDDLLDRSGLEPRRLEQVRQSPAYGPLLAALRDAEAHGLDVEQTFPRLVAVRPLDDAEDPAAVLRDRVERWAQAAGSSRRAGTSLIAGLIPRAVGVTDPDMARGLEERDEAMQRRARALAEQAIERNQIWVRRLGIAPPNRSPENVGSKPSRRLSLTAIAGTSTTNTYPSARKAQRGASKRSTSAISPGLPSTGRRGFPMASGARRPEPETDVGLIPTEGPSI